MRKKLPSYRQRSGQAIVTLIDSASGKRRDYWLGAHGSPESRQRYHQVVAAWEGEVVAGGEPMDVTNDGEVTAADASVLSELAAVQAGGQQQFLSGGGGTFSYAPRLATLRYDYKNHMVEYHNQDWETLHLYYYDAFGRRIAKRVNTSVAEGEEGGTLTRYINGGPPGTGRWQVLEERDAADETLATYVYGNYIDEVLTMHRDGEDYYYHQDDLFSVIAVTDEAGDVVESHVYGDYGAPMGLIFTGAGSSIGNPYLFQGREWDPETEFYHYRTRYLEPGWGRFTSRDWIGTWGDWSNSGNAAAFVASGPTSRRDPLGLQWWGTPPPASAPLPGQPLPGPIPHRSQDGLRRSLESLCNNMGSCPAAPGCSVAKCKEEARDIASRYDTAVNKLRNSPYREGQPYPGTHLCSAMAGQVDRELFRPNESEKASGTKHHSYSCFVFARGYDLAPILGPTHVYVIMRHKCGGNRPSHKLDPFPSVLEPDDPEFLSPKWSENPKKPTDRTGPMETPDLTDDSGWGVPPTWDSPWFFR